MEPPLTLVAAVTTPPPGTIAVQLLIVFALVLANGFFVASEFALVSVRRTRIDQLAAEGNSAAVVVQRAVRDLDRYIAATQVGITIASLLLGGIGHPYLHHMLQPLMTSLGLPAKGTLSSAAVAVGLAYFIMTALHVIIGELMPKSIALQKPDTTALLIGRPMTLCAKLFAPLIWMLNGTGNFLLRRFGLHATEGHSQVHSPEELDILFTQSHQAGALTETERDILHRVVKFSDLMAREIMVPRVEVQGIPFEMPARALRDLVEGQPHTRMPVYRESLDDIMGIVHLKDLVRAVTALRQGEVESLRGAAAMEPQRGAEWLRAVEERGDENIDLMPFMRDVPRVPETIAIDKLLVELKNRRQQMAIVIDEYGGTAGLITMGDLLDQAFGDVHDEFDQPEPEIFTRPDGRIQLPGKILIDEVNERYETGFRDDEADTVAGLVLGALGRPAVVGDEVEINDVSLRVEAVERLRITTVSLQLPRGGQTADA